MQEDIKTYDAVANEKNEFLGELRKQTGPQHTALESHPLPKMLMSPGISMDDYAVYLAAMKGVIKKYDEEVLPFLNKIIPNELVRRKLPMLENDLQYLQEHNIPVPTTENFYLPTLSSVGFALGVAYVIEGSSLGGRFIIKHLQSHIPVSGKEGAQYFYGYGDQTGLLWKQFLEKLTHFAIENNCKEKIIAGAKACFDAIFHHFDKTKILNEV